LVVSALEKICKVSYHWVIISENGPFLEFDGVLLCEGGREDLHAICVLSFEIKK
jgi:hypothetical protein